MTIEEFEAEEAFRQARIVQKQQVKDAQKVDRPMTKEEEDALWDDLNKDIASDRTPEVKEGEVVVSGGDQDTIDLFESLRILEEMQEKIEMVLKINLRVPFLNLQQKMDLMDISQQAREFHDQWDWSQAS